MTNLTRRSLVQGATAAGAAAALTGPALLDFAKAWAQAAPWKPEKGAKLNVLRWRRFVEAEDKAFMAMVDAFSKATGVQVTVASESFDDIQPKASVAANTGQGPDLVWGLHSLPQLFPQKCLDVTDVSNYLGKKYGPWTNSGEATVKLGNKWLALPVAYAGGYLNYRKSSVEKAGFKEFPKDFPGFLELCKGLKKNNTPSGFALGHASGDANGWLHWILWSHGAYLVDKDDKVIINSPETAKALEYCKALYETFIPGTGSWNDSSNNKAFLSGEIHLTNNGISIYVAAKNDASKKDIAEDMDHAAYPVGPSGKAAELQLCFPVLAFSYTKAPQASKAFMAFMMEAENFDPWLEAAGGYLSAALGYYDKNPVWTKDPKNTVFRDAGKRSLPASGIGKVGEKPATAIADFVVVDMFANYCLGRDDIKGSISMAERAAKRIYR
jgi:multiple sugar transport system substrate-binding protein